MQYKVKLGVISDQYGYFSGSMVSLPFHRGNLGVLLGLLRVHEGIIIKTWLAVMDF